MSRPIPPEQNSVWTAQHLDLSQNRGHYVWSPLGFGANTRFCNGVVSKPQRWYRKGDAGGHPVPVLMIHGDCVA